METEPKIIYQERGELAVIYKPEGWLTTGGSGRWPSLEEWVRVNLPETVPIERAGIIHRLDRETTGGVMVALSNTAREYYLGLFKKRRVEKIYWCLVSGKASEWGMIEMPIGVWHREGVVKRKVKIDGKPAKTEYWKEAEGSEGGLVYSWLRVKIYTGRTHQIRVHLAYLGWPIVGDRWYGRTKQTRLMLHEGKLGFENMKGQKIEVKIDFPAPMREILKVYGIQI